MLKGYKTSRDYKRLKELLDQGIEVVCFTTYDFFRHQKGKADYRPFMVTDICKARFDKGGEGVYDKYVLGVRGTTYLEYWAGSGRCSFEQMCETEQVEFIEPDNIENETIKN